MCKIWETRQKWVPVECRMFKCSVPDNLAPKPNVRSAIFSEGSLFFALHKKKRKEKTQRAWKWKTQERRFISGGIWCRCAAWIRAFMHDGRVYRNVSDAVARRRLMVSSLHPRRHRQIHPPCSSLRLGLGRDKYPPHQTTRSRRLHLFLCHTSITLRKTVRTHAGDPAGTVLLERLGCCEFFPAKYILEPNSQGHHKKERWHLVNYIPDLLCLHDRVLAACCGQNSCEDCDLTTLMRPYGSLWMWICRDQDESKLVSNLQRDMRTTGSCVVLNRKPSFRCKLNTVITKDWDYVTISEWQI